MNKKWLLVIVVVLGSCFYWFFIKNKHKQDQPKEQPISLKKHSSAFNDNINKVVNCYLLLKDAFIEADTIQIKAKAVDFIDAVHQIDTSEFKKDTAAVFETIMATIVDVRSNAESILNQTDITEMRRDFSSLTEMMFPVFFNAIQYEGPTLYLQNCPMAFNDTESANWISKTKEIMNPYMGKKHPKYQSGMLNCGEIIDTIKAK
jgi:hypothetical protein